MGRRVEQEAVPDPEDGGPDEATSPTSIATADLGALGYNHYPTPEDPDGPDDPRASDAGPSTTVATGHAAPPPDGAEGGGYVPIGPEFSDPISKTG